jgi:hypothetical protein
MFAGGCSSEGVGPGAMGCLARRGKGREVGIGDERGEVRNTNTMAWCIESRILLCYLAGVCASVESRCRYHMRKLPGK